VNVCTDLSITHTHTHTYTHTHIHTYIYGSIGFIVNGEYICIEREREKSNRCDILKTLLDEKGILSFFRYAGNPT
jgi:hypothetical protein